MRMTTRKRLARAVDRDGQARSIVATDQGTPNADSAPVVGGVIGGLEGTELGVLSVPGRGLQDEKYLETGVGWSVGFGSVLHRALDGDLAQFG